MAQSHRHRAKLADELIEKGLVNIEAHVISSQAYAALKKPEKAQFHHDVAAALLHSILSTGDGKTKETAFRGDRHFRGTHTKVVDKVD